MLADMLENKPDAAILHQNLRMILLQSGVQRTFELVQAYCAATGRDQLMTQQPWYQYARLSRHTASHKDGMTLHQWPKNCPPVVTWDGHTIKQTDLGGSHVIPQVRWIQLHEAIASFFHGLPPKT